MATKKKTATKPNCGCVKKMNDALAPSNGELDTLYFLTRGTLVPKLVVIKKDLKNRTKPPILIPNFCPFCGVKYKGIS